MCGIGGYFCTRGGPALPGLLQCLNRVQQHRGPDDEGVWLGGPVGLCNRRLAILDLSPAGHMPMSNQDDSLVITFNGEIYNSPELRTSLESKGHRFFSRSDTEVVLRLYEEYGADCVARLRGMFAIALYDQKREELLLARDPLGIKPLVYAELPEGTVFASELKALLQFPGLPRKIDRTALCLYLLLNYVPAPWTIWHGVRRLPPGHWVKLRKGRVAECQRYFRLQSGIWQGRVEEGVEALRSELQESVRLHLLSDVPVGVFLSGGLDSSLIAALAQEASGSPVQTFTVTFPDFPTYDEARYARRVAEHLGTHHQEIPVSLAEAQAAVPEMMEHLDEPFADPALVPTAALSRVARRHVKVALSGDGSDELFGGYNKYQGLRYAARLAPLGPLLRNLARLPLSESRESRLGSHWRRFQKFSRMVGDDFPGAAVSAMEVFQPEALDTLSVDGLGDQALFLRGLVEKLLEEGSDLGLAGMDLVLYADTHFVLPHDMLHKVDTASMRHSLEVRVPFVDPQVAARAFSFPHQWKFRGRKRKWVLHQVAQHYFPRSILERPKKGFDIPLAEWTRVSMLQTVQETLSSSAISEGGLFRPDAVQRLLQEHSAGVHDRFPQIWNLYVFEQWRQQWKPTI